MANDAKEDDVPFFLKIRKASMDAIPNEIKIGPWINTLIEKEIKAKEWKSQTKE
jgi:hypothetical protein